MKVFSPHLVSDQRLEGCQSVEKKWKLLQTIYTQGTARAVSCHFSQKYILICGDHVCVCMSRATAHMFGQMMSAKLPSMMFIVNSELILSDGHRKL